MEPDFDDIRKQLLLYYKLKYPGIAIRETVEKEYSDENEEQDDNIAFITTINLGDITRWLEYREGTVMSWLNPAAISEHSIEVCNQNRGYLIDLFHYLINKLCKVSKNQIGAYLTSIGL